MKVLFVGDWAPQRRGCLLQIARRDLLVTNLEGPLLDPEHNIQPAAKAGPHIYNTHAPAAGCRTALSLANNHIMDFGASGLATSINRLNSDGFIFCGAGPDVESARRPVVISLEKCSIGIIACCEAQFGSATDFKPGVAVAGPWVYELIRGLRESGTRVVVSIHRGVEDYPWPSPQQCDLYRSYIDAGAEIVHGHHAHVPQGIETYKSGLILYGLGNFAVDPDKWRGNRHAMWSLGVEVDLSEPQLRYKVIGLSLKAASNTSQVLVQEHEKFPSNLNDYFDKCSAVLQNKEVHYAVWQEVAMRCYLDYGEEFMQFRTNEKQQACSLGKLLTRMWQLLADHLHRAPELPDKHQLLVRHLMIECDSHKEIMAMALGLLSGAIDDRRTRKSAELVDWFLSDIANLNSSAQ